jgi:glycolate oxidase FAD binding subunit
MLNLPFAAELRKHTGSRPRVRPDECARYAVAGCTPKLVFTPHNAREAARISSVLREEGAAVIIRGSGTGQWRPPPPLSIDAVMDMTRCDGISDYAPADLTVTVGAGTKFADLQSALRAHGQFFPSDPTYAAEGTLGGVLSARRDGALRQRYGALRDNVLGMHVCLSDGSTAFTGARVVKSVAGYDIPKLFVGARGTLGVIADVTLKVAPLPQAESGLVATFTRLESACRAALEVAGSPLFPSATTLHDARAARRVRSLSGGLEAEGWTLVFRLGGTRAAVGRQADGIARICKAASSEAAGGVTIELIPEAQLQHAWADVAELACGAAYSPAIFAGVKVVSRPSHVAAVLQRTPALGPDTECSAHPAAGITFVHARSVPAQAAAKASEEEAAHRLRAFVENCQAEGWTSEFLFAPPQLGRFLWPPVPPRAPIELMRKLKAAFDPSGTFDPGRFLGAI